MAVDKMEWHASVFPDNIPYNNAGTHIGMYLAWLIDNDFIQEDWIEEFSEGFERVKKREITGCDLLIERFEGNLTEEIIQDEALEFTSEYYDSAYIDDFAAALSEGAIDSEFSVYLHEDTWDNYDKVEPIITAQFERWKNKEFE